MIVKHAKEAVNHNDFSMQLMTIQLRDYSKIANVIKKMGSSRYKQAHADINGE